MRRKEIKFDVFFQYTKNSWFTFKVYLLEIYQQRLPNFYIDKDFYSRSER